MPTRFPLHTDLVLSTYPPVIIRDPNKRMYFAAETVASAPGYGSIILGGAIPENSRPTFTDDGIVSGQVVSYVAYDNDVGEHGQYERGYGTYTEAAGVKTLTRNLIRSTSGVLLDLTADAVIYVNDDPIPPKEMAKVLVAATSVGMPTLSWVDATTIGISAGSALNSSKTTVIQLAGALNKTTAAWAAGTAAGGLDTGSITLSSTYHFYLIENPITGAVDVTFSLNAATPSLPAGFTIYKRIGSLLTNASSQWIKFFQHDNDFVLDVPVKDIATSTLSTSAVLYALTVPNGLVVQAMLDLDITNSSSAGVLITAPEQTDTAATTSLCTIYCPSGAYGYARGNFRTNTAKQIRARSSRSSTTLDGFTRGWIDDRKN